MVYGYLHQRDGRPLLEIGEKHCFTDNRMNEYASAGTYYFRSGALIKRFLAPPLRRILPSSGRALCASLPYNLMVADVDWMFSVYELEHFLQWGTLGRSRRVWGARQTTSRSGETVLLINRRNARPPWPARTFGFSTGRSTTSPNRRPRIR